MQISDDIFIIHKEGEKHLLFNSFSQDAIFVNSATIEKLQEIKIGKTVEIDSEVRKKLVEAGVIIERKLPNFVQLENTKPTVATLFPTLDCTLNCIYCYSNSGENTNIEGNNTNKMSFETAKTIVDFLINNAKDQNIKSVHLSFFGGGEPFNNFSLMKETMAYAKTKANDIKISGGISTNGILNEKQRIWLKDNIQEIQISMDGPESIQNSQRPLKNGNNSFKKVMETIKFLDLNSISYVIRSTVTPNYFNKLETIVKFFIESSKSKDIHLEPVFRCGREKKGTLISDEVDFVKNYIDLLDKYPEIRFQYSGDVIARTRDRFCGALGNSWNFTPDGLITSCVEVGTYKDSRAKTFIFGEIKDGKIVIDKNKLNYLRDRKVSNLPLCRDCYAKYACAGYCPSKLTDIYNINQRKCSLIKGLLKWQILNLMKKKELN